MSVKLRGAMNMRIVLAYASTAQATEETTTNFNTQLQRSQKGTKGKTTNFFQEAWREPLQASRGYQTDRKDD